MSETKQQTGTQLTPEQLESIGGGNLCSADEMFAYFERLTSAYESLVGFASHVIERVVIASK